MPKLSVVNICFPISGRGHKLTRRKVEVPSVNKPLKLRKSDALCLKKEIKAEDKPHRFQLVNPKKTSMDAKSAKKDGTPN